MRESGAHIGVKISSILVFISNIDFNVSNLHHTNLCFFVLYDKYTFNTLLDTLDFLPKEALGKDAL